jgi:hypothetical protein
MKIAAYYRPPKQVSDIDNKLFKEEVNGHVTKQQFVSGCYQHSSMWIRWPVPPFDVIIEIWW